jgi:hypothetical protein
VLAHAQLLAGAWREAQKTASRQSMAEWFEDENVQPLLLAYLLMLLSGNPAEPPANLDQFWQLVLNDSVLGEEEDVDFEEALVKILRSEERLVTRLRSAHAEAMRGVSLSAKEREEAMAWCVSTAEKKAESTLREQDRARYGTAAVAIVACAETLQLCGDESSAERLVERVRERYPRHRAFQSELSRACERGAGTRGF